MAHFELWQFGTCVVMVGGPLDQAWSEINHYALMYAQDGEVTIKGDIDLITNASATADSRPLAASTLNPHPKEGG